MILPNGFRHSALGSNKRRRGFSMVETMVVSTILLMGLMALTSTSMTVDRLRRSNEARRIATNALETTISEIQRTSLQATDSDVGWAQTLVDTYGAVGDPGGDFPVRGLEAREGASGVLHIDLVTDETLTDQEIGVELGLPIDQNNDGLISSNDTTGDAQMLPVVVTLEWVSAAGDGEVRQAFFVTSF